MRLNGMSARLKQRDDIDFMSETAAAALQGPPAYSHVVVWGTLAFVIAFIAWAAYANIGETTVGDGKVIPSSQIQVVQNLEGGIVSDIKVKVGDVVRKNQVLMLIDDTRYASSFQENKAKNDALTAKIARLRAEVSGTPFDLSQRFRKENPDLAERELSLYRSRQAEFSANTAVFRQQTGQRTQELKEKRSRLTQITTSLEFLDKELTMSRPLVKQGAMSEVELLRLERQANDLKGELESTKITIPRLEAAVAEAKNKLESYVAKFRADALAELNQVRAEQEGTAATGVALKDRVARAVVRSPVNGTIKSVKVTTIGGVVQPGSELLEIVPLEDSLLIEARVKPRDIAFLRPGQKALVKITAYDFSIYGGFPAKLENISADSITDEKKGESFYLVQVRTTSNVPARSDKSLAIIPGMTATVHIQTGEKTFLQYLLKPIIKTKEMAFRER
ncbi:MAG: hemolysin secretion protein D [Betaproteobacteria bacterium RIFCSPLOWO2_12_FULL_62_13]|nr:MAG: hemolysin secretion protein D [Betaproteobacteria bacterium RIFCSPLOWO2_12_FULL_62_13]